MSKRTHVVCVFTVETFRFIIFLIIPSSRISLPLYFKDTLKNILRINFDLFFAFFVLFYFFYFCVVAVADADFRGKFRISDLKLNFFIFLCVSENIFHVTVLY